MTQTLEKKKTSVRRYSKRVVLDDGASTMVHIVCYSQKEFRPHIVSLKHAPRLLDWCEENGVEEALNGGFFMWDDQKVLGELWIDGVLHDHVPFSEPWGIERGSLHIDRSGIVAVGRRHLFGKDSIHHLLQAGPVLISEGEIVLSDDPEGLSSGSAQFDSDITDGRYPRAAIGVSDDYIWSVVCDGRHEKDSGLTLTELAEVMKNLGIKDALNLDGGGSASQISEMKFRNTSRGINETFERGRPVYSAIIFQPN